jgi:uncharacterized protein (TIGR02246 family)
VRKGSRAAPKAVASQAFHRLPYLAASGTVGVILVRRVDMFRLVSTIGLLTALTGSAVAQQPQGQSASPARAEVQKFVRDYIEAHNRADATSLSDAMSHRNDVTSVNDGNIARGWEAIRAANDEIAGQQGNFNVAIGTMDVTLLGSSYALVLAPTAINARNPQGQVVQVKGAVTLVLQKTEDGWKILNEHYSSRRQ